MKLAALDGVAQDTPGADEVLLTDHLVERLRPHAVGQRRTRRCSSRRFIGL